MIIFHHPTGPLINYEDDTLIIEDLNPQVKLTWRMTRMEMIRIGIRCLIAVAKATVSLRRKSTS